MKKIFAILLIYSLILVVISFAGPPCYAPNDDTETPVLFGGPFYNAPNTSAAEGTYWTTARTAYWSDTRVALWSTPRNTEIP